jgi:hypothetical protein
MRELGAAKAAEQKAAPPKPSRLREYRSAIFRVLPLGVFLPMMIFFGSVGPDDYSRNYAGWARRFGLSDWADWINQYATGPRVFSSIVLISVIYLAIAFGLPAIIKHTKQNTAMVVVPVAVTLILLVAGYGAYHVGFDVAERHVTQFQKAKLKEELASDIGIFKGLLEVRAADNPEARGYAMEIMAALHSAGMNVASSNSAHLAPFEMRAYGPNIKGVFILVADMQRKPKEAEVLADALNTSGIATHWGTHSGYWVDTYSLTVGLK